MGTIGIYDYDFFNSPPAIPNLECGKLLTYYKRKRNITILSPSLVPEKYTQFFICKDYEDDIYCPEFFENNVEYRGKIFFKDTYKPLPIEIERMVPDFSDYSKYLNYFGQSREETALIKKILRAVHLRISLDGVNIDKMNYKPLFNNHTSGIILHDYDIAKIKDIKPFLKDLLDNAVFTLASEGKTPKRLPLGNKFPIIFNTGEDFSEWMDYYPMTEVFFFQYNGLMDNENIYRLSKENSIFARQINYNISKGWFDENDFLMNGAINLFKQVLFLRRHNIKILLIYDKDFFVTSELEKFIELLNLFLRVRSYEKINIPRTGSLYKYCSMKKRLPYEPYIKNRGLMTTEDMRDVFTYIRIYNYELFKMFYEWSEVIYKGGDFVHE